MARVVRRTWRSEIGAGAPRRDRADCQYEAYVPDPLGARPIVVDADVAADIAEAEGAIVELNARPGVLADTEALARLLLRAEAVASSKIEGLEVGPRRLLRFEAARALDSVARDVTAAEVLGNVDAMAWATDVSANRRRLTRRFVLDIHRRLLADTEHHAIAGRLRTEQNWIGGSSYNPCRAEFVPPPPELVPELVDDLVEFMNDDTLSPIMQAALIHAQFETIHPFADGNGRVGRALVHVMLRHRGLAPRVVPPISLALATRSQDYINGLAETRYRGSPATAAARTGVNRWIAVFASACTRAVQDVGTFETHVDALLQQWRARLGRVRANSATDRLLAALPGAPIVTVTTAATLIDRSYPQTNEAIRRLEDAGVLHQISVGRRNRAFEASELIDVFTDLERRLASPRASRRRLNRLVAQ